MFPSHFESNRIKSIYLNFDGLIDFEIFNQFKLAEIAKLFL